jgi:hypothetical protein
MRVLRVLTFEDWDPASDDPVIRIAGLVENKTWEDLDGAPVAVAYQCPKCSLSIWEGYSGLPAWLCSELDEVVLCMRVGAYTSMAIMCRRLVERIATERGGKGARLKSRLVDLTRRKILSNAALLWMERAREIGNVAAHSVPFDMGDKRRLPIVLLALALAQAVYVEAPSETEDEHGIWTTSWEKTRASEIGYTPAI